jgi:Pro-kumamolisin, activation domain/Abnormal spindle-like microcephaly-assoc'd, ASPM-SPD-2-Hydin
MRIRRFTQVLAGLFLGIAAAMPATARTSGPSDDRAEFETVSSRVIDRVVEQVDDAKRVRLAGNVHPMARTEFDMGRVDSNKLLERVVMVLKRSPEQEAALTAFNERQYDPNSPDFHHWLSADEFGKLYGPSDADIAAVTNWLQNHGLQIHEVGKGRVYIQFDGTVANVERAFHLEMHNYAAEGKVHLANDRDPEIPAALSPVVTGVASLHDFFPTHYSHPGNYVKRDLKTGKYTVIPPDPSTSGTMQPGTPLASGMPQPALGSSAGQTAGGGAQPQLTYTDPSTGYTREELTPYDVATIYNILPLWNAATPINGTGVKVAIVALSDVAAADINTYRSSFGLPATTLTTVHSGADPGLTVSQGENTEDVEMVSATAPGAQIVLVSDVDTATTNGLTTGILYIVNNAVAPILTMSYGECELKLGTAGNTLFNQTFQQAATAGISAFVAAGDSGSAACTPQNGINPPYSDPFGLAVNGMASSPYVTAVGGTDLQWPFVQATKPISTYWNATNDVHGATAKGYMPEMSWNGTCSNPILLNVYTAYANTEALCNAANLALPGLVQMGSGGGGVSNCTVNNTTSTSTTWFPASCSGGYAKPTWQAGVAGIPADGKRDLPDISLFGSYGFASSTGIPGSSLLICQASGSPLNSCDYTHPGYIIYQENGGTSAASPMAAGVMALVLQKAGSSQGLANPMFYSLAAKENYAACNSNTVAAGNACIFYDTTTGTNAMNCTKGDKDCVTNVTTDTIGILSGNSATAGYDLTTGLGSFNVTNLVNAWAAAVTAPAVTLSPTSLTFASTTVGSTTAAQVVTVKNSGTATLTLTSETLTGTNATSFLISANTCTTSLAAAATCAVSVEFKPATAGTLTASLSIADSATGSPQTVALTGTGTAAAAPAVTLTPTSLTFASTTVGVTTAAQVVTVKNSGTAALTLTSETLTGTNASSFLISANTCTTSLAAAATCTVSVEFKPATAGALTAALSIADNATGSPQAVTLSGTGAAAAAAVTLTPTSLTFASTTVGSTTAAQVVTVKNSGTAALTLTSETLTGTNATSFLISANTCTTSLAAAATCTVSVEFKPAAAGALTASLSIADNATGSPQTVSLTGTGAAAAAPAITLTPTSIAFPATVTAATSVAQVVTVKNTGTAAATISSIALGGTNATSFVEIGTCGTSLAAGASCSIYVAFKPASAAALAGTLSVTDNATGSPQTVTLTGTGTAAPALTLSATTLAFATTTHATTSAAQTVTLTNATTTTINLTSIALAGTSPADFVELNTCGATLAPAATCQVFVAFKPAAVAAYTASVSIADNAASSPQSVTISGTGN